MMEDIKLKAAREGAFDALGRLADLAWKLLQDEQFAMASGCFFNLSEECIYAETGMDEELFEQFHKDIQALVCDYVQKSEEQQMG